MIEVAEFPQLTMKYSIMSVPKIVINEVEQFAGLVSPSAFLNRVIAAVEKS